MLPAFTFHATRSAYSAGEGTWAVRNSAGSDGIIGWVDWYFGQVWVVEHCSAGHTICNGDRSHVVATEIIWDERSASFQPYAEIEGV